jgi:hypothetical protein
MSHVDLDVYYDHLELGPKFKIIKLKATVILAIVWPVRLQRMFNIAALDTPASQQLASHNTVVIFKRSPPSRSTG